MRKIIITVPAVMDSRHRNWAKVLERIDISKPNGYAFEGQWLRRGERAEVPVGSLLLVYDEVGSIANWHPEVRVLRVEADGSLTTALEWIGNVRERSWALAVRDQVAALLAEAQGAAQEQVPAVDLSQVPTEALLAELRRRGIEVPA